jgi:hypothetical protein
LAWCGIDVREDFVDRMAGTTEDGTEIAGMLRVLDYYGIETEAGTMTVPDLRRSIDIGRPTIITLQAYRDKPVLYADDWEDGHYVIAIGYDLRRIYFEDPSVYRRSWLSDIELADRWHDIDEGKKVCNWGCVIKTKSRYKHNDSAHMD